MAEKKPKKEEVKKEEVEKAVPKKGDKVVAEGKAITSKKGILGPGDVAKAEYFKGGQEVFDNLVKEKILV